MGGDSGANHTGMEGEPDGKPGRVWTFHMDHSWGGELRAMNRRKAGRPFRYPDSLMAQMMLLRAVLGISYMSCRDFMAQLLGEGHAPDSNTIRRRAGHIIPALEGDIIRLGNGATIRLIANDADTLHDTLPDTGTISDTGRWQELDWKGRQGFRLHALVDAGTGRLQAFRVTYAEDGDEPQLPDAIRRVLAASPKSSPPGGAGAPYRRKVVDGEQTLLDAWMTKSR